MHPSLNTAVDALEARGAVLHIYIRDDDAGWDHDALRMLLDITAQAEVPIDLAAIPAALDDRLVVDLVARMDAAPGLVGVHQHGYAHANHEAEGRRCEFGPSRSFEQQRDDIAKGRALLRTAFGDRVDPIFTPPWNRCVAHTGTALQALGFAALSRDRRAKPPTVMKELPVDVDWSRAWREGGADGVARVLADAIELRSRTGSASGVPPSSSSAMSTLGLMLHHAAMGSDERACLGPWLQALRRRPCLRWLSMREALLRVDTDAAEVREALVPALSDL